MFLKKLILPAISTVGCSIGQMLRAVQLDGDARLLAQKIDFHLTSTIERNRQARIQPKAPSETSNRAVQLSEARAD